MARRRRWKTYKCTITICIASATVTLLLGSIYIIVLHLNNMNMEATWQHGVAPSVSTKRVRLLSDQPRLLVLRQQVLPFALIPRPRYFHKLDMEGSPMQCDDGIGFWWHSGPYEHTEPRVQAMLKAYVSTTSSQPRHVDSNYAPQCGITVAMFSTRSEASQFCASHLPSLSRTLHESQQDSLADAQLEWHMATLHESRLIVCATTPLGAFRFSSSLQQMVHGSLNNHTNGNTQEELFARFLLSSPSFFLEDWPLYAWRGLHLDTVRHFMPISFLKRYLKAMAFYKANVFHWHLTDDQAWRLFLPSRPKLVNASARTSPGFYDLHEVRELVEYATALFIDIVPGIETPGHSLAALSAYPELACIGDHFETPRGREGVYEDILCAMTPATIRFANDIFADVAQLFPAKFVHIGGDEAPTTRWKQNEELLRFAKRKQFQNFDVDIFEAWLCFVTEVLRTHGRTPIVWDDHFQKREGASEKCPHAEKDWVVQAWLLAPPVGTSTRNKVMADFPFRTIASPYNQLYLDQPVGTINFSNAASFSPGEPGDKLMGGCATMWTEHSTIDDVPANVYPRYLGVADSLWGATHGVMEDRRMDMPILKAALKHCEDRGPLKQDFDFTCGKFNLPRNDGVNKNWRRAHVKTDMQMWAKEYSPERAVDGDPDTYFWAISPKADQIFQVGWLQENTNSQVLGQWLCHLTLHTGSRDRPNDILDYAEIRLLQWVRLSWSSFKLQWTRVAQLKNGRATISEQMLKQGPVLSLKLVVTKTQVKWMTLPEIDIELCSHVPQHPVEADLPLSVAVPSD